MSYEHCDAHDMDATNGCPKCEAIDRVAEARENVAELAKEYARFTECLRLPGERRVAADDQDLMKSLVLAYLRGTTARGMQFNDWEEYVSDVLEGRLK